MKLLKQLFIWLKRVWHWLGEGKTVIMGLLVLIAVSIYPDTWSSEDSIRRAGYLLQILGMLLAITGLLRVRTHFGQKPLRQFFVEWLKRFPKWKGNVFVGVGSFKGSAIGGKAYGQIWTPDKSHYPIAKRIDGIVRNIDLIRKGQHENTILIDKLSASHEKLEKQVAVENENTKKEIQEDLKKLHTGDLITSLVGLMWLTIGISMSTMAKELYGLIQ